ncbi:hypothetical protein [Naumannella halotolerans]|uniref:Uncharacterized protein n=1 Tax=Naumannella halotolerans TaxID=993414 RepID=A0A4R7J452_9ACTN|nr:hypothetical protein [Naumannella halotolerans]TDT31346.1 hypothetical protein CLV29_2765 [Naumannella halotolerans]
MDAHIFTTEPMAVRALAAEIRFAPAPMTKLIEGLLGRQLGELHGITLEDRGRASTDVVLSYMDARVGIEAKLDHEITETQILREMEHFDALILLVDEAIDAKPVEGLIPVLTWSSVLDLFENSRLLASDIKAVNDSNRQVRRRFAPLNLPSVPSGWSIDRMGTNGGRPSILVQSPVMDGGRHIIGQLEGSRNPLDHRCQFTMGVVVGPNDLTGDRDAPEDWLDILEVLGPFWEGSAKSAGVAFDQSAAPLRADLIRVRSKIEAADARGVPRRWVKGYTDSYIGLKSIKVGMDEAQELLDGAVGLMTRGFDHLTESAETP